jgi:hypothetical protein
MAALEVFNSFTAAPVGHCIYCGSTNDLSDEHVIPLSLGGRYILPQASCPACARITSTFEREVSRGFMLPARSVGGFPTRRPKERPKSFPLQIQRGEEFVEEQFSVEDYPALLMLPRLAPSGYLHNRAAKAGVEIVGQETISFGKPPVEAIAGAGGRAMKLNMKWDVSAYARLVAKAAYGYAVGSMGVIPRDEVPVLPLILGQADDASCWLGSADFTLEIEQKRPLHALGSGRFPDPYDASKEIVVVLIKLFADSGATGFEVVVRKATPC